MSKYYFSDNKEEMCYTIKGHKQQMIENRETERTVFEAEKSGENDWFYCIAIGYVGIKPPQGDPCGRQCDLYEPRNGKSGCCKSFRKLYISSDKSRVIKI